MPLWSGTVDEFDLIVIGAGAGTRVAASAANRGLQVALVERSRLGGICLNTGCIPSKILIHPADVLRTIQDSAATGIKAAQAGIDFAMVMERMRLYVERSRTSLEDAVSADENVHLYRGTAEFTDDYIIQVGEDLISAPKIAIAAGARTLVPLIPGLVDAGYLDHASLLNLREPPQSLIIIGGGYIGCEFAHFFSAAGTEVTLISRSSRILPDEEPEMSEIASRTLSGHINLHAGREVIKVVLEGGRKAVYARNKADGKTARFEAEEILLAAGRRPNTDLLKPEKTGVETDDRGWIKVDEYLETSRPGIWAFGDILGKHMFRHVASYCADVASNNILDEEKEKADFHAVPHAVFIHPTIASVGLREDEAVAAGYDVLVGRSHYSEIAMGYVLGEKDGFAKVIVEDETERILGCSVIGPEAPALIQQVTFLMNAICQSMAPIALSQVIHPTVSEVLVRAFGSLERSKIQLDLALKEHDEAYRKRTVPRD
ncbi:MAG TPA: dihydrolipoyl dehydrogenase [Methanotrichaceae archaeon]|nr:dihydrolipoyl dehydrogenase [Methanotrichaceae archaeon]